MIDRVLDWVEESDAWPLIIGLIVIAVVVAAVVGIVLLTGSDAPSHGTVVDKHHVAPWVQTINTGNTTTTIVHPESWSIKIDDGKHTGWREVSEQVWVSVAVGDYYDEVR